MQVSKVMTRRTEVIPPDATLREAAARMRDLDIGLLPVCDGQRLIGTLTDRDITIRSVAEGCDPTQTRVSQAMTPEVVYCFEDQDVKEAARVMQEKQVRRLPIVDREKRLVGIVSLGDIALEVPGDKTTARTLKQVSKPTKAKRKSRSGPQHP